MNDKAITVRADGSEDQPVDAHLWVCHGKNVGRRYRVDETPRILGRALDCDIVVQDERASQRHARIRAENGSHVVEDLGSTNGTFVNNQRVHQAILKDGDLIQIGETIFEYLSFEERTLSTTSRGTLPDHEAIPENIRSGAQQMLRRVRRDQVEVVEPSGASRGAGSGAAAFPTTGGPQGGAYRPSAGGSAHSGGAYAGPGGPGGPGGGPGGPAAGAPDGHGLVPAGGPYGPVPYTPYPHGPGYAGHYTAYYDEDDGRESEPAAASGGGLDVFAILGRMFTIARLFWPYWPLVAALAFVGVMLGALHFKLQPPGTIAFFQIVLNPTGTGAVFGGSGDPNDRLQFFGDQVVERYRAPPIIEAALERMSGKKPTADDVESFSQRLGFFKIGQFNSNMYGGTLEAATAEFGVQYLNTHLDIFLEREIEMGLSQVKADVRFFREEVANAAKSLEEAEEALARYKSDNPEALPEQARSNYDLLFQLQRQRASLQQSAAALEASIRENRRQKARTERLNTTGRTESNPYQAQIAQVNTQIAAAKAAGKGDDHPDLVRLRAQLAELEALSNDPNLVRPNTTIGLNSAYTMLEQAIQQDQAKLRAAQTELEEVEKALADHQAKIGRLPQAEAAYQELARNYDTAQKEYALLLNKLKNAELQLERERARADAQYNVVVAPRKMAQDNGQIRKKRLIMGGAGGVALAFGLITAILFFRGSLTLSLILGRDIDLKALFQSGDKAPPPRAPAAPGLGPAAEPAMAALPERAGQSREVTDVVPRKPPSS